MSEGRTILVTGSGGFIGRNLVEALRRGGRHRVVGFEQGDGDLEEAVSGVDHVFHLAGVNRPETEAEFAEGNAGLTRRLCEMLEGAGRRATVVLSSSTQAETENPYGRSKRESEEAVAEYAERSGASAYIYRLPNVFGKWSRPNYNTVVATFCHNIARDLPVRVDNPNAPLKLVYIDDVVRHFVTLADAADHEAGVSRPEVDPVHSTTVGRLRDVIAAFREERRRGLLPELSDPLTKCLYSTYLSFLESDDLAYPVELRTDPRGWLFEWLKSPHIGQIFVSRTLPGITRGNHYHDTKVEKFCVISGEGIVRFRHMVSGETAEYRVDDREIRVVDIPPGYTHSIENTGAGDMITLFWANEIFDPTRPDTYAEPVIPPPRRGRP